MNFKKLKEEMEFKWRVQNSGEFNTTLVAYIDARDVEDRLDAVCGPDKWQNKFTNVGTQRICSIGINVESDKWVWKEDGGTESNIEKDKGLLSDCFKRSAVKWGIGRFLYSKKVYKLSSMPLLDYQGNQKSVNNRKMFCPAHDIKKHGPATGVPNGILRFNSVQIMDVNKYIWEFLKPYLENKN